MRGHQKLRILQYNVQKSRDVVLASLFRDPKVLGYDILAIQEPWRNPFIAISYQPLKKYFQLTYLEDALTRVCFYINKRLDPSSWRVSYTSRDIIALTISSPYSTSSTHVFNVYNEVGTNTLSTLADTIGHLDSDDERIVLGDFNLYHPLWSITHRCAGSESSARYLLTIIEDF